MVAGQPRMDWISVNHLLRNAGGLGDVRLLGQVLGQQLAGGVDGPVVVVVDRTDDQLRAVDIVQGAPGAFGAASSSSRALSLYSGGTQ